MKSDQENKAPSKSPRKSQWASPMAAGLSGVALIIVAVIYSIDSTDPHLNKNQSTEDIPSLVKAALHETDTEKIADFVLMVQKSAQRSDYINELYEVAMGGSAEERGLAALYIAKAAPIDWNASRLLDSDDEEVVRYALELYLNNRLCIEDRETMGKIIDIVYSRGSKTSGIALSILVRAHKTVEDRELLDIVIKKIGKDGKLVFSDIQSRALKVSKEQEAAVRLRMTLIREKTGVKYFSNVIISNTEINCN